MIFRAFFIVIFIFWFSRTIIIRLQTYFLEANKWLFSLCFWLFPESHIANDFYVGLILIFGAKCVLIKQWWNLEILLLTCLWSPGREKLPLEADAVDRGERVFLLGVETSRCRSVCKTSLPAGSAPRPLKEALASFAHRHSLSHSNKISRGSTTLTKGVVLRDVALGSASPQAADRKAAYYQTASLFQKSKKPDFLLLILFHTFLKIN